MARKRKETRQTASGTLRVQTVEEWLAAGNTITVCPPGMRSEDVVTKHSWGKGKKRSKKKKAE